MATQLVHYEYLCHRKAWKMLAVIGEQSLNYDRLWRKYLEFEGDFTGVLSSPEEWDIDSTLCDFARAGAILQQKTLFGTKYSLVPEILALNNTPHSYDAWATVFSRDSFEDWKALPKTTTNYEQTHIISFDTVRGERPNQRQRRHPLQWQRLIP